MDNLETLLAENAILLEENGIVEKADELEESAGRNGQFSPQLQHGEGTIPGNFQLPSGIQEPTTPINASSHQPQHSTNARKLAISPLILKAGGHFHSYPSQVSSPREGASPITHHHQFSPNSSTPGTPRSTISTPRYNLLKNSLSKKLYKRRNPTIDLFRRDSEVNRKLLRRYDEELRIREGILNWRGGESTVNEGLGDSSSRSHRSNAIVVPSGRHSFSYLKRNDGFNQCLTRRRQKMVALKTDRERKQHRILRKRARGRRRRTGKDASGSAAESQHWDNTGGQLDIPSLRFPPSHRGRRKNATPSNSGRAAESGRISTACHSMDKSSASAQKEKLLHEWNEKQIEKRNLKGDSRKIPLSFHAQTARSTSMDMRRRRRGEESGRSSSRSLHSARRRTSHSQLATTARRRNTTSSAMLERDLGVLSARFHQSRSTSSSQFENPPSLRGNGAQSARPFALDTHETADSSRRPSTARRRMPAHVTQSIATEESLSTVSANQTRPTTARARQENDSKHAPTLAENMAMSARFNRKLSPLASTRSPSPPKTARLNANSNRKFVFSRVRIPKWRQR